MLVKLNLDQDEIDNIVAQTLYNDYTAHLGSLTALLVQANDWLEENEVTDDNSSWMLEASQEITAESDLLQAIATLYAYYDESDDPLPSCEHLKVEATALLVQTMDILDNLLA